MISHHVDLMNHCFISILPVPVIELLSIFKIISYNIAEGHCDI